MNAHARVVLLGGLLLAGCSHAPKPTAEVAPEEGKNPGPAAHPKRPVATKPPGEATAGAVVAGSSTSKPAPPDSARVAPVVPQLSSEEAQALDKSSREQIDAALAKLATVDAAKLDADKQRKLQIAQGFLKDAVDARKEQDWMRASQLATKARVLADELTAH